MSGGVSTGIPERTHTLTSISRRRQGRCGWYNGSVKRFLFGISILIVLILVAGCASAEPSPQATPEARASATPALTPYRTATPRPQISPDAGNTPTPLPTMTPTPLSYKVVKGDDMFGIALRHGITLPMLLTANPTVNPSFLSVGTILQIPQAQATPKPGEETPVPVRADLASPVCYPTAEAGLWCLVLAQNNNERAIENLSLSVTVAGGEGSAMQQQSAYPLVNLLPPGASLALGAYFAPPAPAETAASASAITAFYQPEDDVRYPAVTVSQRSIAIQPGGASARVQGSLNLAADTNPVDEIWVAASAFDAAGQPVGLRRWEARGEFSGGTSMEFDFMVYSLGPEIARVELIAEAHTSLAGGAGSLTATAVP